MDLPAAESHLIGSELTALKRVDSLQQWHYLDEDYVTWDLRRIGGPVSI